ncbi:MAG: hypothetical protein J6Y89_02260 [Lachnospiraceae bacterium]|nr:hypothetical protein [Lachnospiraceae bacterium]
MKIKFESEYFKYAGKVRRIIMPILLAATCALSYLFIQKYWQLGLVIGPVLGMGVISFMDFYLFSGTPVRRKQAPKSAEAATADSSVLIKALKQDLINKSIFNLVITAFITGIVIFFTKINASRLFVVLCAGAAFAAGQLVTRLTVLISRKLGTTFQRHSIIVYIALFICAVILLPFVYLIKSNSKLLAIIFAVVFEALSVLAALLILRTASKAILPKEETTEADNSDGETAEVGNSNEEATEVGNSNEEATEVGNLDEEAAKNI